MTTTTRTRSLALAGTLAALLALPAMAQVLGAPPAAPTAAAQGQAAAGMPDWRATLAELKLTPRGEPRADDDSMEVLATTADGRTVEVEFSFDGRIESIEDANYRKNETRGWRAVQTAPDLDKVVRDAGFTPMGAVETKKNHVEVIARNQRGEAVELHIDRAGYIYKQEWLR